MLTMESAIVGKNSEELTLDDKGGSQKNSEGSPRERHLFVNGVKVAAGGGIDEPASIRRSAGLLILTAYLHVLLGFVLVAVPMIFGNRIHDLPDNGSMLPLHSHLTWFGLSGLFFVQALILKWIADGVRGQKSWAYWATVMTFIFFIPGIFLPLGLLGLFWILSKESREYLKSK